MRYLTYLVVVLIAGYLLTGFVQVRPGERIVVRRFGQIVAAPGPGLWVGLPWGVDRVDRVPVDMVRRVSVGYQPIDDDGSQPTVPAGQLLTGDHNLVNVGAIVHYVVAEPVAFIEQGERADELIVRAADTVLAEWVAGRGIDDVLLQGKVVLPELLVRQTQERVQSYRLGVQVQAADVTHLYPPSEVKNAFEEVTRAQTAIRTREHEARQEAARALREAQTDRYGIEMRTDAYVNEKLHLAHEDAGRFLKRLAMYQELRKTNPNFLAALWWDEIGRLLSRLKETGRVDLLDHHLAGDGLDITVFPNLPKKK
jgi:membrane protease subunit HflK